MKVVLDTNVIVSGLNFPGNERDVLNLARRGEYGLYLSSFVLHETEGVLARKFGWDGLNVARAIRALRDSATMVEPRRLALAITSSEADNRILACVEEASADYLVTGDRRHLLPLGEYLGTKIINSAQFLTVLARDS